MRGQLTFERHREFFNLYRGFALRENKDGRKRGYFRGRFAAACTSSGRSGR